MMQEGKQKFSTKDEVVEALIRSNGQPSYNWSYFNRDDEVIREVFQWGEKAEKEIRQVSQIESGEWIIGTDHQKHPLYRLNEIINRNDETVFVCEGEKSADAANTIGLLATTSLGGCNAYERTYWRPLTGRTVFILPDNDEPGEKYADDVAELLARLRPAARVKILHVPSIQSIGDKADIADRLNQILETEQ